MALIVSAATVLAYPFLPHRPPDPPPVAVAPLQYVAVCCGRPISPEELRR